MLFIAKNNDPVVSDTHIFNENNWEDDMTKEKYEKLLSSTGSMLYNACMGTLDHMDHSLVSSNIDDILGGLHEYMEILRDEIYGRFNKLEALSSSTGLTGRDLEKMKSLKETVMAMGINCHSIDEYVIDACSLTMINELLKGF